MFGSGAMRLAGWTRARERDLALAARSAARREIYATREADDERFLRLMEARAGEPHVVLGDVLVAGRLVPYVLTFAEIEALFVWLTASTGAGKSRLIVGGLLDPLVGVLMSGEEAP